MSLLAAAGTGTVPPGLEKCEAFSLGGHIVTATIGSVTGSAGLTGAYTWPDYSCEGEHYDVNGNPADGCEVPQPLSAHTQGTAQPVGSMPCFDSTTASINGVLPSDERIHQSPAVPGFNSATGSAPEWYSVFVTGGTFCVNDFSVTLTVTGSNIPACYEVTLITDKGTFSVPTNGTGTAIMTGGSGSYDSNTTILFEVQTYSMLQGPDNPSFNITFHL